MDQSNLQSTPLVGHSTDPGQTFQQRCSIAPGIERSPCFECDYRKLGYTPDICRDFSGCRLGSLRQDMSTEESRGRHQEVIHFTCQFEGCKKPPEGKSIHGQLCKYHKELVRNRVNKYAVPQEKLYKIYLGECKWCGKKLKKMSEYCQVCSTTISRRKKEGQSIECLTKPIRKKTKITESMRRQVMHIKATAKEISKITGIPVRTVNRIRNGK